MHLYFQKLQLLYFLFPVWAQYFLKQLLKKALWAQLCFLFSYIKKDDFVCLFIANILYMAMKNKKMTYKKKMRLAIKRNYLQTCWQQRAGGGFWYILNFLIACQYSVAVKWCNCSHWQTCNQFCLLEHIDNNFLLALSGWHTRKCFSFIV